MSWQLLENRVSTHIGVTWEDKQHEHKLILSSSFPWPFIAEHMFLLLKEKAFTCAFTAVPKRQGAWTLGGHIIYIPSSEWVQQYYWGTKLSHKFCTKFLTPLHMVKNLFGL